MSHKSVTTITYLPLRRAKDLPFLLTKFCQDEGVTGISDSPGDDILQKFLANIAYSLFLFMSIGWENRFLAAFLFICHISSDVTNSPSCSILVNLV